MSIEQTASFDPRVQNALEELRGKIAAQYPTATFEVTRDPDEPVNIDLVTTVDLADPDEVLDLVIERLIELQVDEGIPVHVIPIRTPERVLAEVRSQPRARSLHRSLSLAGREGIREQAV